MHQLTFLYWKSQVLECNLSCLPIGSNLGATKKRCYFVMYTFCRKMMNIMESICLLNHEPSYRFLEWSNRKTEDIINAVAVHGLQSKWQHVTRSEVLLLDAVDWMHISYLQDAIKTWSHTSLSHVHSDDSWWSHMLISHQWCQNMICWFYRS